MLKVQKLSFPAVSVAIHLTEVSPMLKTLPFIGVHVIVGRLPELSVPMGSAHFTVVLGNPGSVDLVMFSGHVNTGISLSKIRPENMYGTLESELNKI